MTLCSNILHDDTHFLRTGKKFFCFFFYYFSTSPNILHIFSTHGCMWDISLLLCDGDDDSFLSIFFIFFTILHVIPSSVFYYNFLSFLLCFSFCLMFLRVRSYYANWIMEKSCLHALQHLESAQLFVVLNSLNETEKKEGKI